jgi:hypothetical protein
MKKNSKDNDMPIGHLTEVKDFLPAPDKLVMPDETVKVTIALTKSSVKFFKDQAKKSHTQYQKMIRNLVDGYAAHYRVA